MTFDYKMTAKTSCYGPLVINYLSVVVCYHLLLTIICSNNNKKVITFPMERCIYIIERLNQNVNFTLHHISPPPPKKRNERVFNAFFHETFNSSSIFFLVF